MKLNKTGLVNPLKWKKMLGETDLEKQLNSYLTTQFIGKFDVPSDECLLEAKRVIEIIRAYDER